MELHFYPGQHLLLAKKNRAIVGRFEAWGGPASIVQHPNAMPEEPTWAGRYVIDKAEAYITPSWAASRIKWGTYLKDMKAKHDVYYQLPSGSWGSIAKDFNISRDIILGWHKNLYGKEIVPTSWIFNDFGPIAIRWFKDLNGNKLLDAGEVLSGQMFHTTPVNEMQHATNKPVLLSPSHGCIHLKPAERDMLIAMGAFKPKSIFVICAYHERF